MKKYQKDHAGDRLDVFKKEYRQMVSHIEMGNISNNVCEDFTRIDVRSAKDIKLYLKVAFNLLQRYDHYI